MTAPRSQRHLLVRGGTLVTMDPERRVEEGDVLISEGKIAAVGSQLSRPPATRLLDARGLHVLPGFIQGHVHLGQSLFRGLAENRELLPWLRERIWPLEAAHTEESSYWSGMLGAADCLRSGTTTIQDMGLVHGTDGILRAVEDSGLRGVVGKCLMDSGEGVPPALLEETGSALEDARELALRWNGRAGDRIRAAICPRFVLSCSEKLWEGTAALAREQGLPVHTHLLETQAEEEEVRAVVGKGQVEYLDELGILDTDLRVAHGVWLEERHLRVLAGRPLKVIHCPSANAKLGSGTADLVFLRAQKSLSIGIGTDGAPCNNDMDVLEEIRLAAFLQSLRQGPGRFPALHALELATIEGARALGLEQELGSLEVGKEGDVVVLDLSLPSSFGAERVAVYDRIVYGTARDAVRWVVVDGEVLVEDGTFPHLDESSLRRRPGEEIEKLLDRAQLP